MAVYEIINVGANKALNISGSNLKGTSLYNNQGLPFGLVLVPASNPGFSQLRANQRVSEAI